MIWRRLLGLSVFAAAVGAWELWARAAPSFFLPRASTVAQRAWEVWPTEQFASSVTASLGRLAVGFAIGAGMGTLAGIVLGASPGLRRLFEPLTELLRAIPPIVLAPVLILMLGFGDAAQVAVIAFGVSIPVLVNTIDGVHDVPPEARDTAALLHVGPFEVLYRLYLPAALPSIVAGLRIALSVGLVMVVASELVVASGDGLGRYIDEQRTLFHVPEMYAGILFLGLLGVVLNQLFRLAERRVLHWHVGAVGEHTR